MSLCRTYFLFRLLNDGLAPVGVNKIRKQDYFLMVEFMSAHPVGRDIVWEFYRNNYQRMVDMYVSEILA